MWSIYRGANFGLILMSIPVRFMLNPVVRGKDDIMNFNRRFNNSSTGGTNWECKQFVAWLPALH